MQTLEQLLIYDPMKSCVMIPSEAKVIDEAKHYYRGAMLDTSRNFIPIEDIAELVRVMGHYKMNVFHWHVTDSHSFPLKLDLLSRRLSQYGAYSSSETYSMTDVIYLKDFAELHGVYVIIEIDMPAHVGYGFQYGPDWGLGELALCVGESPWEDLCLQPPCGQLNPINERMYIILRNIFREIIWFTGTPVLHLGGDEVKFECWNKSADIQKYLLDKNLGLGDDSFHHLWGEFTLRARKILNEAHELIMGNETTMTTLYWSSSLTSGEYLMKYFDPATSNIMYWDNLQQTDYLQHLFANGFKVILANHDHSYLDCGFPSYVNDGNIWCSPYKTWQDIYDNDYEKVLSQNGVVYRPEQILGGQVALWTEVAGQRVFMSKMLPRLLAAAERWWSYPKNESEFAKQRIQYQQLILAKNKGLRTRAVAPEYCMYNPTTCYDLYL
ncbi:hypothetical protein ACOME3_003845 [Neoechinorhynchus agilis]